MLGWIKRLLWRLHGRQLGEKTEIRERNNMRRKLWEPSFQFLGGTNLLGLLGKGFTVNVGQDTTLSNGDVVEQLVQFVDIAYGKLKVNMTNRELKTSLSGTGLRFWTRCGLCSRLSSRHFLIGKSWKKGHGLLVLELLVWILTKWESQCLTGGKMRYSALYTYIDVLKFLWNSGKVREVSAWLYG